MKALSILFFSLILLPPFFANAEQSQPNFVVPPIIVKAETNPVFNVKVHTDTSSTFTNYVSPVQKIRETCSKENCSQFTQQLKNILWQQRYPLMGGALLIAYGSINVILLLDYAYFTATGRWVTWKSECSYADLWTMSKQDVEKELLHTIAQCNYNVKNPIDKAHPLIKFMQAIDTEIYCLKRYIKIASHIKKVRLMKLFYVSDEKLETAKQLLERAQFIKQIFLSWLADTMYDKSGVVKNRSENTKKNTRHKIVVRSKGSGGKR